MHPRTGAPIASTSCGQFTSDDHEFVAFRVGHPPTVLRLVQEPPPGAERGVQARLREVRWHRQLEVDAIALPAPLGLRSIEFLKQQHRVQPPRVIDVADPGSSIGGVSEDADPERADRGDVGGVEEELGEARQTRIGNGPESPRRRLNLYR